MKNDNDNIQNKGELTNTNDELQTRREFFKRAAKSTLPIIGAVTIIGTASLKPVAQAWGCYGCGGCAYSCVGSCARTCLSCVGTCLNTCIGTCYMSCGAF